MITRQPKPSDANGATGDRDAPTLRVAALLCREAGRVVLDDLTGVNSGFEVVCLFTHRREPSTLDPARPERPEFTGFRQRAAQLGIPFHVVDTHREARAMAGLRDHQPFDLIVSVSWAFLVTADVLALPRVGAVNQHRGKLPDYALARPVVRALEHGDAEIILTTHLMNEEYDRGEVLVETPWPTRVDPRQSVEENAERIERELLPVYPVALREAVRKLQAERVRP